MQETIALPGLVQSLTCPFSRLSRPAQEVSAAAEAANAGASAGPREPSLHERQSGHGYELSVEDLRIMLAPRQQPVLLPPQQPAQQKGRRHQEPAAAATIVDSFWSQQAQTLDAPQSPASATHAAHVLAGLVSPDPEHAHEANTIGASATAGQPSPRLEQELSSGSRPGMQQAARRSPAGPGQSRLDELLGIASQPESAIGEGLSEEASHHQPGSTSNPAQRSSLDDVACQGGDISQSAAGGKAQLEARLVADDKRLTFAKQFEGHSAGQHSEAAQSMPENASSEPSPHLQNPVRSSLADMPARGCPDKLGASPMQPSLSMAAAGSFCNFQIAAGGLVQWRHLLSGEQVRHAGPSKLLYGQLYARWDESATT